MFDYEERAAFLNEPLSPPTCARAPANCGARPLLLDAHSPDGVELTHAYRNRVQLGGSA
jgi:hypothetical protein